MKCVSRAVTKKKMMEAGGDELEDDGDAAENNLLKNDSAPCVCCKVWDKDTVSGWAPSYPRKLIKKPTKTHALLGNTRKERNLPVECGFAFRHYENTSRYIEQYREHHCSTFFIECEAEWKPVLGIDVPDPYLPKIGNSSDIKNVCLTGKRAETVDRISKDAVNGKTESDQSLPSIATASNGAQVYQKVEKRKRNCCTGELRLEPAVTRQCIKTAPTSKQDYPLPSVSTSLDLPHEAKDSDALDVKNDFPVPEEPRPVVKERVRLPKFQWMERHVPGVTKPSDKTNMKAEEKSRPKQEDAQNSDSDDTGNRQSVSRGNLRLGSTVKTPATRSRQGKITVGKFELFSSSAGTERANRSYQTRSKFPGETAFIKILGQQTGPPPKKDELKAEKGRPKTKEMAANSRSINQHLPLHYLTRFGRRQFHHVLEARSFKPGERKLGTAVVADRN